MSELIDLSYYKMLPQQFGTQPKILINEVTNDIEFYCCTNPANALIEYSFFKVCEICDIPHEKVYWGADLYHYANKIVTLTPFNLNKEWLYLSNVDAISNLQNKYDLEFVCLLTNLFGATLWNDDVVGYIENNNFKKAFHFNTMFEVELALYLSKGPCLDLFFLNDSSNILNEYSFEELNNMKIYIDKFLSIKKHEWLNILDFPESAGFDKAKFWFLKKFGNAQKQLFTYFDK